MTELELSPVQLQAYAQMIRKEVQSQVRAEFQLHLASLRLRVTQLESQVKSISHQVAPSVSNREMQPLVHRHHASPMGVHSRETYASISDETDDLVSEESELSSDEECFAIIEDCSHEHSPPESLYNYCMFHLAVSPHPFYQRAFLYWLSLFVVQFITITAFVVVNDINTNVLGFRAPADRPYAIGRCMLASSSILGIPHLQYCIGYVSIFLVASAIKSDDLDSLMVTLPQFKDGPANFCLTRFAWFWQTVYVPGCFSLEVAAMFANAEDSMAVVMNTLAATFIMEIDNMMYSNMLMKPERDSYQQQAGRHMAAAMPSLAWSHACAQAMFVLNLVLMTILYTGLEVTFGMAEISGEAYLAWYLLFITPFYSSNYFGRTLLQQVCSRPVKAERCSVGRCCLGFAIACGGLLCGCACYGINVFFSVLRLPNPRALHHNQMYAGDDLSACLNASDAV